MKKTSLHFDQSLPAVYGTQQRLAPRIARVLAHNPSPFTFRGTGVYLVGDANSVTVIDPGPNDPKHLDALVAAIGGRTVSHILITHTHRDHSPAAAPLKAITGARTYGYGPHARHDGDVEEGGDRDFVPDVTVRDGDIIESGSYCRIKTITLSYDLPLPRLTKVFKSASVYITGQNLITITHYSGYDPEVNSYPNTSGNYTSLNTDYNPYPNIRTYLAGLKFGF